MSEWTLTQSPLELRDAGTQFGVFGPGGVQAHAEPAGKTGQRDDYCRRHRHGFAISGIREWKQENVKRIAFFAQTS